MKKTPRCAHLILIMLLITVISCSKRESHVDSIVTEILDTKTAVQNHFAQHPAGKTANPIFISVWDFDGTIIKGDCSEGYAEDGTIIYKGLAQTAIENNLSKRYQNNEFGKFFDYYQRLLAAQGHLAAYVYLAEIFAGQNEQSLIALSTQYFDSTLKNYYFASSIAIINKLMENNIHVYVISASPDFFVKGAAQSLNISAGNIHGIRLKSANGLLTGTAENPVTYAEGKITKLREIIQQIQKNSSHDHVYAIAAFGNSYHNDGPFMFHVATQQLPAGKPVVVMINGGATPEGYKGYFQRVNQAVITK